MLTDDHRQFYREHGYVVVGGATPWVVLLGPTRTRVKKSDRV